MHIRVNGTPQQQGSKTAFVIGKRAIMKDANEKALKPWRDQVANAAGEEWGDAPLLTGPVKISVIFGFPRPKSHYGTGKNAHTVKASAPHFKTSTPDLDKLQRAIGDALTGKVFRDDAQVVVWDVLKVYASAGYCDIIIIDLSGGNDDGERHAALGSGADPDAGDRVSHPGAPLEA